MVSLILIAVVIICIMLILFQSRGGGFEVEIYYPQWRRINKPIDRHHVLLDCLAKLVEGMSHSTNYFFN